MQKIIFFGATGMLAKPVIKELLNAGFDISAMVRNPNEARKMLPNEVRIIQGDLQNPKDIAQALQGQEVIYCNLSIKQTEKPKDFHTESDGLKIILQLAHIQGIKRIVWLSSLVQNYQGMNGFDWWAFKVKKQAIDLVKESGIPYTIFYPSNFMESLASVYRQGNRLLLAGKSEHKMYFVAGSDYGKQVVKSLQILKGENREYVVQGLETFTADEACEIFKNNYTHAKLSISRAPLGVLKLLGNFVQKMNYGYHILTALNKYPEKFTAEKTWEELGKPQVTLLEFSKQAE